MPGGLGGGDDVGRPQLLALIDFHAVGQIQFPRPAADPSRVHDPEGLTIPPAILLITGQVEYLAPLEEEQAFFGEKCLVRRQVDDDIVRLDRTEVGIDGRRQLEIARRSPEQVDASLEARVVIHQVLGRRRIGEYAPLLAWIDVLEFQGIHGAHESGPGFGQAGPAPAFVDVRDASAGIHANSPFAGGIRHRDLRPGDIKLGRPSTISNLRGPIPGAVPVPAVLALRQNRAIHFAVAQRHGHPVAVAAVAGSVQRDAHRVAVDVEGVAGGEPRNQTVRGLLHVKGNIESAFGVEHPHVRRVARRLERIRRRNDETAHRVDLRPDAFVDAAVDLDVDFVVYEATQLNRLLAVERNFDILAGLGPGVTENKTAEKRRQKTDLLIIQGWIALCLPQDSARRRPPHIDRCPPAGRCLAPPIL